MTNHVHTRMYTRMYIHIHAPTQLWQELGRRVAQGTEQASLTIRPGLGGPEN